jgi:hypothetical protein
MTTITLEAETESQAIKMCKQEYGWTPDAVRKVDSGEENVKAWMCFESASDAKIWDNQK